MNTILSVGELFKTQQDVWHSHAYWKLVYCTGGKGTVRFEHDKPIELSAGDLLLIPPRERHCRSASEDFSNIHIAMEDLVAPCRGVFQVRDDRSGGLRHAFSEAQYFYGSDIRKRQLVLSALGDLICGYLTVLQSNEEFSESVRTIRSDILKHFSEPDFELDTVIHSMPFHYDYLRKRFKKEVGVTPLEYLTELRMKKAEQLLGMMPEQPFSVTEVAEQCGYADALYFSRVFKKYYGCAPSVYLHREKERK